jgi:adenylate cyclase class 2
MAAEIEIKLRLDDPAGLRDRLARCGAAACAAIVETNRIFDTADGRLRAADFGLRLRTSRGVVGDRPAVTTLTFKGRRSVAAGIKSREEVEVDVGDAGALAIILARLGFVEVIRFEKRREAWRLGDCVVCIDELPGLGFFVEIEGPGATAIQTAQRTLGLSDAAVIHETYARLAAARGKPDEHGARVLRFE